MALVLICLVSGLADNTFAAEKIMTIYQRAAGVEATTMTNNKITGFQDFAAPVGTGVAVNGTGTTLTLGEARKTDGAIWYGGDSDAGYCVNGICDFGIGIRAYFEFRFDEDTNHKSEGKGQGFTFAIINGSNNTRTKRGGSPTGSGLQALMAYAGPGNTASLGLEPPKMAIEFDTYPNRGNVTSTPCTNDNRYDSNNRNDYNHIALMLWGDNPTTPNCSGGYTRISYDDNVHRAGKGDNSYPYNSYWGDPNPTPSFCSDPDIPPAMKVICGYYQGPTVTWLENNVVHSFRIEIIRESISTDNIGNYTVKAWVVEKSSLSEPQLAALKDTSIPYPPTPTGLAPQINRPVELSSAHHTAFNKMLFGFTQATSNAASEAQNVEITNFDIYSPQCVNDWPPGEGWTECANENNPNLPKPWTCTFSGGTRLVAYGRNCFYNYQYQSSGVLCSNGIFGDPHVGVYKKCYYK